MAILKDKISNDPEEFVNIYGRNLIFNYHIETAKSVYDRLFKRMYSLNSKNLTVVNWINIGSLFSLKVILFLIPISDKIRPIFTLFSASIFIFSRIFSSFSLIKQRRIAREILKTILVNRNPEKIEKIKD